MVAKWFTGRARRRDEALARKLADAIFARIYEPQPYSAGWAQDTLDGRFEWSALHGGLLLDRLSNAGEQGKRVAPLLVDELFRRYDYSLRETGVGDTVIAKKVRALGERFYGLASAIQQAIGEAGGSQALAGVLERNGLAGGQEAALAIYLRDCASTLSAMSDADICSGEIDWPAFPIDRG